MHLSNELQKLLKLNNSSIELAKNIDGELPASYAFFSLEYGRNFRIYYARQNRECSILLFERTKQRDYEICYLRGLFDSLEKIVLLLKYWMEEEEKVKEIADRFEELEVFEFDDFEHPNKEINEKWRYIENRIFNRDRFWKNRDFEERYSKMVKYAKRKEEWKNLFPFTSHDWLRFSLNKALTHSWVLGLHIIPTWTTEEGKYYVGVPELENKRGRCFEKLEDAIEFYDKKLNEYQPTKWA